MFLMPFTIAFLIDSLSKSLNIIAMVSSKVRRTSSIIYLFVFVVFMINLLALRYILILFLLEVIKSLINN